MGTKIKVSIIIPIYNTEKYIKRCIESIINQTLKEIEIIFINDGTTDNSLQIVELFQKTDNRIIIHSQKNQGLSIARNNGINKSHGEYLYFLDSDDEITINTLELLYQSAIKDNLDIVFCNGKTIFENPQIKTKKDYYNRNHTYNNIDAGADLMRKMLYNKEYKVNVAMQMIKKEFLTENHLYFEPNILHEDNIYTFKAILLAKRCKFINQKLYIRRIRDNSITTSKKSKNHYKGYYKGYKIMKKFLHSQKLSLKNYFAAFIITKKIKYASFFSWLLYIKSIILQKIII